jgi:predicted AAA+ superfamily ATPase
VFFADCGWRNLVSAGFGDWNARTDRGTLLETAIEHWLRNKHPLGEIRFWRSQARAEVDFVVHDGGRLMVYEVKARALAKPSVSRSMRSFLKTHRPECATVVNLSLADEISIEGIPVRFAVFPHCMD